MVWSGLEVRTWMELRWWCRDDERNPSIQSWWQPAPGHDLSCWQVDARGAGQGSQSLCVPAGEITCSACGKERERIEAVDGRDAQF